MYVACLMAGTSSRLLPLTKADHKALLRVGKTRIVDAQMRIFDLAGIDTFSFVVGHGGSRLATHLLKYYPRSMLSIINNAHFADRNLDWSAYLALSSRSGDVLYYEGDIIVCPEIIRDVAAHSGDVCVVVDPVGQSARIDTRVIGHQGHASALLFAEHGNLNTAARERSQGEFVCFLKLSNRAREYVVSRLREQSFIGPMKLYEIFSNLFGVYPAFLVSTAGRPWVEIDNAEDLLRARRIVKQIFGASTHNSRKFPKAQGPSEM